VCDVSTDLGLRRAVLDDVTADPEGVRPVTAVLRLLWWLTTTTTKICLRYRVTGLAAEAGFFALLSLPPLILGMVGSLGYIGGRLGPRVVADLRSRVSEFALAFLTPDAVDSVITPTFNEVARRGRIDIISIGFLLALWSGSRALNVYIDTITIMYGLSGHRGIVRTRALSFSLYVVAVVVGIVVIPLVLIGPGVLAELLQGTNLPFTDSFGEFGALYWPVVSALSVITLATLYSIAPPVRTPWRRDLPGAVLALVLWYLASLVFRQVINVSVNGTSIYGPLSTPILVLIWLYLFAIAALIGAALNAAVDERWPHPARAHARETGGMHPDSHPVTPMPAAVAVEHATGKPDDGMSGGA
jgi:membrane protein